MKDGELLDRAKAGLITPPEVAEVARALREQAPGRDPYTLLHILGRAEAVEHEPLVAEYLSSSSDPMVARIALQVLCSHWEKASEYQSQIERFIRGVEWDGDEAVRLVALSSAGELLRGSLDDSLLQLLVEVFTDANQSQMARQAAYFAIARASGKDWRDLPPANRALDLEGSTDPAVLAWADSKLK